MVILPPHCTHISQREELYHLTIFKGAFQVERAEIEAMKQLSSGWGIKLFNNTGVAISFAIKEACKGAWTKNAVLRGLTTQVWCLSIKPHFGKIYRRSTQGAAVLATGQGVSS